MLVHDQPGDPTYQTDLVRTLRTLGNFYLFVIAKYDRAEQTLREARDLSERIPLEIAQRPAVQFEHAVVLLTLAKLYGHLDRARSIGPFRKQRSPGLRLLWPRILETRTTSSS